MHRPSRALEDHLARFTSKAFAIERGAAAAGSTSRPCPARIGIASRVAASIEAP
jgi:hypothetical protein